MLRHCLSVSLIFLIVVIVTQLILYSLLHICCYLSRPSFAHENHSKQRASHHQHLTLREPIAQARTSIHSMQQRCQDTSPVLEISCALGPKYPNQRVLVDKRVNKLAVKIPLNVVI